ncbi:MAG: S-layer homology domain-containing protein, partial [Clostridia bacterium]|nr:S-layer homology domain-containing protein [Clostridia bacterium]
MKKRILSFVLTALFFLSIFPLASGAAKTPFADVRDRDWFSSDVRYVYENNIMTGTSKTTFEPKTPLTRYMYVTIIFRLGGAGGTYPNKFTDVPAGKWYSDAVGWAQDTGIVEGYRDGRFHGNNKITRQEMAVMTARYLSYAWADLPDSPSAVGKYADESKISGWARPSFETVRRIGLIMGDQNGNANPGALATRAETAALIGRLHKSLQAADKTPRIGGNPLEGYTVCSGFMRENELEDLRNVLRDATGVDLPAAATADGRKIEVREDDSL